MAGEAFQFHGSSLRSRENDRLLWSGLSYGNAAHGSTGSAKYHLAVRETPDVFGRKRHMTRPFALEITVGDFTFAAGHRRIVAARPC
jgi:hypothetical protein